METADRWRKKVAACRSPNDMVRAPAEILLTTPWKYRVIGRRACKTSCPWRGGWLPIVPYDVHTGARQVAGLRNFNRDLLSALATKTIEIRFPKGNIKEVFEEIRRVLEREGIITFS